MVIIKYFCIIVMVLLFWVYLYFVWIKNVDIEENEKLY